MNIIFVSIFFFTLSLAKKADKHIAQLQNKSVPPLIQPDLNAAIDAPSENQQVLPFHDLPNGLKVETSGIFKNQYTPPLLDTPIDIIAKKTEDKSEIEGKVKTKSVTDTEDAVKNQQVLPLFGTSMNSNTETQDVCRLLNNPVLSPYMNTLYQLVTTHGIFDTLYHILPTSPDDLRMFYDGPKYAAKKLGVNQSVQQLQVIANLSIEAYKKKITSFSFFRLLHDTSESYLKRKGLLTNDNYKSIAQKQYKKLQKAYKKSKKISDRRAIFFNLLNANLKFIRKFGKVPRKDAMYILSKFVENLTCAIKLA